MFTLCWFSIGMFCIFHRVSVESTSKFVSKFWGLCLQTSTGALPLDPAGDFCSSDSLLVPPYQIPGTPLVGSLWGYVLSWCLSAASMDRYIWEWLFYNLPLKVFKLRNLADFIRQKLGFSRKRQTCFLSHPSPFEGCRDNVRTSSSARWKVHGRLPIREN